MRNIFNYTSADGEFSSTSWKMYKKVTGENPYGYICNECGCTFYMLWHSNHIKGKVKCPVCGEYIELYYFECKQRDLPEENDMITDYGLENLKTLIDQYGGLNLSGYDIAELPENLKVPRELDIELTNISSLPSSLKIGGGLIASYTKITSIPKELLHIHGELTLCGCDISSLPDGLTVDRDLRINNTSIKRLPSGLIVGGSLHINNTPIEELPSDMKVGASVYAKNTHLKRLNGFDEKRIIKNY